MIELLAPAGSFEALEAAINAGADAVYVGGNRFNARAYATNFDIDELNRAVHLCHQHGVRLFVTVNTLYQDENFKDLYKYILDLYKIQVDALIVQDEGLINYLHDSFPDFEIHASTQCTVHSLDGVQYYANKGVKRVVLARENSIDEIKRIIQQTPMEIEVFVHGALCVCYSGQCFMSAQNGGRSANKGQCAQPCRLTYQLKLNGQNLGKPTHLLSMADLCTIDQISELIEAGVHSLKIEGRMKRPEYVYAVVSSYRKAIDAYYQQKNYQSNRETLMQLFNRDFTSGYLFRQSKVVNDRFSGNQGILAAQVLSYDQKRHKLKMKALIDLHQQDGIRIGNEDHGLLLNKIYVQNKLVNHVAKGTIFEIDDTVKTRPGTEVYRTLDHQLEKETALQLKNPYRKVSINMKLDGKIGEPLAIELSDGINLIRLNTNSLIENAKSAPLSIRRIEEQCKKIGNTIYALDKLEINFPDNGFLPIKELNELRRQALEKLDIQRASICLHTTVSHKSFDYARTVFNSTMNNRFYIHIENIEQLEEVLKYPVNILFPLNTQFTKAIELARSMGKELIGVIPAIVKDHEWKYYDHLIQANKLSQLAISHPAALHRYGSSVTFGLPSLNLMNHAALSQYPFDVTLSTELSRAEVNSMLTKEPNAVAFLYGHPESMRMEHCPVSYHYFNQKKPHCGQCKHGCYTLVDRKGAQFSLTFDEFCRTTIYHPQLRNWLDRPNHAGYLHFTLEDKNQVRKIMKLLNL